MNVVDRPVARRHQRRAGRAVLGLTLIGLVLAGLLAMVVFQSTQISGIKDRANDRARLRDQQIGALVAGLNTLRTQVTACADKQAHAPGCTEPAVPPAATIVGQAGATGATGAAGPPGNTVVGPEGPPGAAGAPGVGVEGPSGANGADGQNGANGADGKDGRDGTNGQPPVGWTYVDALGFTHTCSRVDGFDPTSPQYTCD